MISCNFELQSIHNSSMYTIADMRNRLKPQKQCLENLKTSCTFQFQRYHSLTYSEHDVKGVTEQSHYDIISKRTCIMHILKVKKKIFYLK